MSKVKDLTGSICILHQMFIRSVEATIRLEAKGCILLINELLRLGKTILICLIKDIYFTYIVVFIRKL